jgi:hypothetical protein
MEEVATCLAALVGRASVLAHERIADGALGLAAHRGRHVALKGGQALGDAAVLLSLAGP